MPKFVTSPIAHRYAESGNHSSYWHFSLWKPPNWLYLQSNQEKVSWTEKPCIWQKQTQLLAQKIKFTIGNNHCPLFSLKWHAYFVLCSRKYPPYACIWISLVHLSVILQSWKRYSMKKSGVLSWQDPKTSTTLSYALGWLLSSSFLVQNVKKMYTQ